MTLPPGFPYPLCAENPAKGAGEGDESGEVKQAESFLRENKA